jgi:hypothetical protein
LALASQMAGAVPAGRGVRAGKEAGVRFTGYCFGSVRAGGVTCERGLITGRGKIRRRETAASGKFRGADGHTPAAGRRRHPAAVPPAGDRHRR